MIILVEGDSELGALPIFSERLKVNLDELGISVVQAASGDSIPPLMELLDEFAIYNLGVMDSDKRTGYGNRLNLYFTQGIDFEDEIYNSFDILDYITYLEEEFLGEGKVDFFIGKARRLNFPINPRQPIVPQLNSTDQVNLDLLKTESEQEVLQDLRNRKSILTGRDLAIHVTAIPQVYQQIILEAKRISEQC